MVSNENLDYQPAMMRAGNLAAEAVVAKEKSDGPVDTTIPSNGNLTTLDENGFPKIDMSLLQRNGASSFAEIQSKTPKQRVRKIMSSVTVDEGSDGEKGIKQFPPLPGSR